MTAIIDSINLKPGGMLFIGNKGSDKVEEISTFTCGHCNRMVVMHPKRERPRNTCKRCMKTTCDSSGCVTGCNVIDRDMERAFNDLNGQPWLLRLQGREPTDRLYMPDGTSKLLVRKDHNYSQGELTKDRRS